MDFVICEIYLYSRDLQTNKTMKTKIKNGQ